MAKLVDSISDIGSFICEILKCPYSTTVERRMCKRRTAMRRKIIGEAHGSRTGISICHVCAREQISCIFGLPHVKFIRRACNLKSKEVVY